MTNTQQDVRATVDRLIETNDMRGAIAMERQLQNVQDHTSPEDLAWATARLRAFSLPWQTPEIIERSLQTDLLRLAATDIDLKNRIGLIIMPYPESSQITQKKEFLIKLSQNQEKLKNTTIRTWLKLYLQDQDIEKLYSNLPDRAELSLSEKHALAKVIAIFDYLRSDFGATETAALAQSLAQPVPERLQAPSGAKEGSSVSSAHQPKEFKLEQALSLYPQINDQVLTAGALTLSNKSAAGTVKNWIYDYRSALGGDKHSTMDRGNYLFNTKNTKALPSHERNIVAIVLKSLDDGTPLKIDVDAKKIVFDDVLAAPQPTRSPAQQPVQSPEQPMPEKNNSAASFALPPRDAQIEKPPLRANASSGSTPPQSSAPAQTIPNQSAGSVVGTDDDMTFTSQHALPAEKEKMQQTSKQSSPYHMNPIGKH